MQSRHELYVLRTACLVMQKGMTPLAGAVDWSSSALRVAQLRYATLRQTCKQAGSRSCWMGCPLLITAQTRIIVSDACMRDQMIFGAVRPHEVETFSRCREGRFEYNRLGPFISPGGLERKRVGDPPGRKLGPQVGPSWHGAESTRLNTRRVLRLSR